MLVVAIAPGEFLFLAPRYGMAGMRTVEEVRHARLLELLAEFPTTQALADKLAPRGLFCACRSGCCEFSAKYSLRAIDS